MKAIQRSDIHLVILAGSLLASAWMVAAGLRQEAKATRAVAAAIDCSNEFVLAGEERFDFRVMCKIDADNRRREWQE